MIYKLDGKGIKKLLHDFYGTRYGKSIFIVCYAVPFITFMVTMGMFLGSLVKGESSYILVAIAFLCMNIFVLVVIFIIESLGYMLKV